VKDKGIDVGPFYPGASKMMEENKIEYSSLKYDHAENIGDEIQSLAAEQFLPRVDNYLNRDSLGCITKGKEYLLIMNGWFSHCPDSCFPPSDSINPVFIGFHMTDLNDTVQEFLSPENVEYFKRNEPIGCRDKKTRDLLAAKGVASFYSKCLTITFPKRKIEPKEGKVFLVDASHIPIPEFLHKQAIPISHEAPKNCDHKKRMLLAKKLLKMYRDEARLVITTRLHCALPCIGMGVPVIFFGNPNDYRVSVLDDLNIDINKLPNILLTGANVLLRRLSLGGIFSKIAVQLLYRNVDWNPQSVCIDKEKEELEIITKDLLRNKIIELEMKKS
jgi:hypothetical protein